MQRSSLVLLASLLAAAPSFAEGPRRFALVVGENEGLSTEERLRFAEDDARRFLGAMTDVGAVEPGNATAVYGADAAKLRAALAGLKTRLDSEATPRDWLILYVSAHASDGALHLRGTELPLSELLEFLQKAPVGVGMLVLDSCRSGAATRLKGLKPAGPVKTLEAAELEGRIVISASGVDEYAQESDELEGSFFTHHLVAALRGAGDSTKDGRVTLEEAYGYAYARTLESTVASSGGLQRPSFRKDLRGHGELVVSEPSRAKARVVLAVDAPGRWLVVAERGNSLVAEVEKGEGHATFALAPGPYRFRLRGEGGWLERSVTVPSEGGVVRVEGEELERASRQRLAMKGEAPKLWKLTALGEVGTGVVGGLSQTFGPALRLRRDERLFGPFESFAIHVAGRQGTGSRRFAFQQRELELTAATGPKFRTGRFELGLGLEAGALLVSQTNLPDGTDRFSAGPVGGLGLEFRVSIVAPLSLTVHGHGGAAYLRRDSGLSFSPRATCGLGVGVDL